MEKLCGKYVTAGPLSHLHLFLSQNGKVLVDMCRGKAREDGTPLSPDSLYRLASMTKPLTIAVALTLVEEGRLSLDTAVADILPEFADIGVWTGGMDREGAFASVPCRRPMTILDLMRHMAGFSYSIHAASPLDRAYAERALDAFRQRRTGEEYAAALAGLPLLHQPGERFHYSVSIDVLGLVMERLTSQRIEELMRRRLFDPLGMKDSFFVVPPGHIDRLTDAWLVEREGAAPILYDRGAHSRWRMPPQCASAGGGLVSSTGDYHRFLRMMMAGGELDGARILSRESVALMMRNQLPGGADLERMGAAPLSETRRRGVGMGLGAAVLLDPARAAIPGSTGTWFWGGLLSTGFFLDPARGLIGLVMTQLMPSDTTRLREDFRCAVYERITEDGHG